MHGGRGRRSRAGPRPHEVIFPRCSRPSCSLRSGRKPNRRRRHPRPRARRPSRRRPPPRTGWRTASRSSGRFAYRLGDEGQSLGPAAGFSVGGSFEHRYLALRRGARARRGGRLLLRSLRHRRGRVEHVGARRRGALRRDPRPRRDQLRALADGGLPRGGRASLRGRRCRPDRRVLLQPRDRSPARQHDRRPAARPRGRRRRRRPLGDDGGDGPGRLHPHLHPTDLTTTDS